jgi:ribosomal-protein-alanine N-acetyltransferase
VSGGAPPAEAVVIRRIAGRAEAEACAALMAASEPWITLRRGRAESLAVMEHPAREHYVALADGAVAGFLVLSMQGAIVGYIQSVAVAPAWRGRGIGTALVRYAEARIFQDSPNVFLCVSSFNGDARRLYERLGYAFVGELRDYLVSGHSELLYRKSIGPIADFEAGAGSGARVPAAPADLP